MDHVYTSKAIADVIMTRKIQNSATDHLPVLVDYSLDLTKLKFQHTVTKGSFRNFTRELWNTCLSQQDWLDVEDCEDVNDMVNVFNGNIRHTKYWVRPFLIFYI